LTFIGAGNIAHAIVGGLVNTGKAPDLITVCDPDSGQLKRFDSLKVKTSQDNRQGVSQADVVIFSVKPNIVKAVASELAESLNNKLTISVAAGITSTSLQSWIGNSAAIIRCMPNTPALVQRGMTGLYATAAVSPEQQHLGEAIMSAVGQCRWFDEETQLDAVTAISGSGPAYFFYLIELMQKAGVELGLSPEAAAQLVKQTALGAAEMVQGDSEAEKLRIQVTSPGGTTQAALETMMAAGLEETIYAATRAARDRSIALAGPNQEST